MKKRTVIPVADRDKNVHEITNDQGTRLWFVGVFYARSGQWECPPLKRGGGGSYSENSRDMPQYLSLASAQSAARSRFGYTCCKARG